MNALEMTLIVFSGSLVAGFFGSLTGLGGGMIIIPLLALGLNVDIHYAIGANLISVIATSSGASAAYIKQGFSNIRAGLLLETATCLGAIFGVLLGSHLPSLVLAVAFALLFLYCAFSALISKDAYEDRNIPSDPIASALRLDSTYPSGHDMKSYHVQKVPLGYFLMFLAGSLSGTLGLGCGVFKVLALDKVMGLPFKVSTTTSNFMIGVTAAASAGIYLNLGYIDPLLTMPVMLGVSCGSVYGARLLQHINVRKLRYLFICMLFVIALQMLHFGYTRI